MEDHGLPGLQQGKSMELGEEILSTLFETRQWRRGKDDWEWEGGIGGV